MSMRASRCRECPPYPSEQQDPHSRRLYDAVDYRRFNVTEEHIRKARHASFANISYLDDKLGELLTVLKQCDFDQSTQIILCADHGDMLGERGLWYKMNFFEGSSRIPLVIASPSNPIARRVSTPVALHHVLPTLVELAGGNSHDIVGEIDGRSMIGLAAGHEDAKRAVYSEYCAEGSVGPMIMIRRGNDKFCFCAQDPPQLFDLERDPLETRNLATDPALADVVSAFTRDVKDSQQYRHLVNSANRIGKFASWDFQPQVDARYPNR